MAIRRWLRRRIRPTRRGRKLRTNGYRDERMPPKTLTKLSILAASLAGLVVLPIPLLPPQRLVEFAQSSLGLGGEAAYLLCAIAVQVAIYSVLGLSATLRGQSRSNITGPLASDCCAATYRCRLGSDHSFAASWTRTSLDQRRRSGGSLHGRSHSRTWRSLPSLEGRSLYRDLCYWRCNVGHLHGRLAATARCNRGKPSADCCCGWESSFR
jgi:hypothetical protein